NYIFVSIYILLCKRCIKVENNKAKLIGQIERFLADNKLVEEQRQTLRAFDRFNELEAQCRLSTRHSYLRTLHGLGVCVQKPYEKMKKEELQMFVAIQKKYHRPSVVMLQQAHLKRFFRWLEWTKVNKDLKDEDKLNISDVRAPYVVRWMRVSLNLLKCPMKTFPQKLKS
ncbi:MAG: hypothetical protein ACFFCW_41980, partial [Candidatus Hodarchaeota archaeon]